MGIEFKQRVTAIYGIKHMEVNGLTKFKKDATSERISEVASFDLNIMNIRNEEIF